MAGVSRALLVLMECTLCINVRVARSHDMLAFGRRATVEDGAKFEARTYCAMKTHTSSLRAYVGFINADHQPPSPKSMRMCAVRSNFLRRFERVLTLAIAHARRLYTQIACA